MSHRSDRHARGERKEQQSDALAQLIARGIPRLCCASGRTVDEGDTLHTPWEDTETQKRAAAVPVRERTRCGAEAAAAKGQRGE